MRKNICTTMLIPLCASLMATAAAHATVHQLHADLDGLQMVPPNASPAFGAGDFTLDDVTGAFAVTSGTYQDLLGGSNAVVLNVGTAGANGAFITTLTNDTPGAMTGTYSGSATIAAGTIPTMINGDTYIRITSSVFPGGEIRGQLIVPEPASLGLLASLASIAAGMLRRRPRANALPAACRTQHGFR